MKKFQLIFCTTLFAMFLGLSSCGGDAAKTDAEGAKGNDEAPKEEPKAEMVVSAEMTDFMSMLKGKSNFTEEALAKYGINEETDEDMGLYDLKEAKVIAVNNECYTMEAGSGMTIRTYILCWEAGKIKSVEDKGMK